MTEPRDVVATIGFEGALDPADWRAVIARRDALRPVPPREVPNPYRPGTTRVLFAEGLHVNVVIDGAEVGAIVPGMIRGELQVRCAAITPALVELVESLARELDAPLVWRREA